MRRFEVRELRPCKLAQLAFLGARAFVENNKGMRCFAPFFMWEPDDRYFLHGRVSQKHAFNFNGRNVFAATDDDVLHAVANFDVTIRMHDRGVAGMKPSAAQRLLGRFGVVVVAGHDHVAARDDFTLSNTIVRHVVALRVHYTQLARCNQLNTLARFDRGPFADGERRMFRARLANGDERRCFGQSVNVRDRPTQIFFKSLDRRSCGRRTGRDNVNSFRREATKICPVHLPMKSKPSALRTTW